MAAAAATARRHSVASTDGLAANSLLNHGNNSFKGQAPRRMSLAVRHDQMLGLMAGLGNRHSDGGEHSIAGLKELLYRHTMEAQRMLQQHHDAAVNFLQKVKPHHVEAPPMQANPPQPQNDFSPVMPVAGGLPPGQVPAPTDSGTPALSAWQSDKEEEEKAEDAENDSQETPKEVFDVLPLWRRAEGHNHYKTTRKTTAFDFVQQQQQAKLKMPWYIVHPHNPVRGIWDMCSLLLVVYDIAIIPLQYFDPAPVPFTVALEWVTRFFWTMDMPLSFTTGYVTVDGFIEVAPRAIITRYLQSWFLLDALIVLLDWMELGFQEESNLSVARMGKATRTFRIIRMLRLLRLARMRSVLVIVTERFRSEKIVVIWDVIKLVVLLLAFAHFTACAWFGVGAGAPPEESWIHAYDIKPELATQYMISFHWSVSQFAGGMDEFTPESLEERVFAIVAFLLAFVVAAWFVSSLTSSMTKLNIIGSDQTQQLSTLRVYLHQNKITSKLALRVQRNAQHALAEQTRSLPEHAVRLLALVSEPLRVEIHLEMYSPLLSLHPFFKLYLEMCPHVMRKVCHLATNMVIMSPGDVIFSAGEQLPQPKMYILCEGNLDYVPVYGDEEELEEGDWVAEAVLWTRWVHRGDLVTKGDGRILMLDAHAFQSITSLFEHDKAFDPRDHAYQFIKELNAQEHPTDLAYMVREPSQHRLTGFNEQAVTVASSLAMRLRRFFFR